MNDTKKKKERKIDPVEAAEKDLLRRAGQTKVTGFQANMRYFQGWIRHAFEAGKNAASA